MKSKSQQVSQKTYTGHSLKSFSIHIKHLLEHKLWLQVLIGLFLGILVGLILGPESSLVSSDLAKKITQWLSFPGYLFLRVIKLVIIPLIFSSIIVGLLSSGSSSFLKKIGVRLFLYFIITTTIAVSIGFAISYAIAPGSYTDSSLFSMDVDSSDFQTLPSDTHITKQIINVIPDNPVQAMAQGDMFGVVIMAIIGGIALLFVTKKHFEPTLVLLETVQQVSMRIVKWIMYIVPLAVFGLMAEVMAQTGFEALKGLGMYVLTVLAGLLCLFGVYLLIIWLFSNKTVGSFLRTIFPAQLLAFTTSSSAVVMPLSMKIAEDKLKIKRAISQFVIPVGATINMDGTALYQAVATVFLAQLFGIHIAFSTLVLLVFLTVGASIGAPAVPGVGILILASILSTAGIPAAGIAIILGVDRILDMFRTSVNVTGDLTACTFFDKNLKKEFEK
ncbi:MAG: dicarboxylate/amino acid:cation symporter [Candidatus Nanoarchaeia archaeon]